LSSHLLYENIKIIIYKAVIYLLFCTGVKHGHSHRLRLFENRVVRRIFGPKREEVAGGWRRLHNQDLHNLYTSPDIIRVKKLRRVS
jgi:hypothetical protein